MARPVAKLRNDSKVEEDEIPNPETDLSAAFKVGLDIIMQEMNVRFECDENRIE